MAGFYGQLAPTMCVWRMSMETVLPMPIRFQQRATVALAGRLILCTQFLATGRTSANVNAVMPCILGGDFAVDGSNFVDNSPILTLRGAGARSLHLRKMAPLYPVQPGRRIIFDGDDCRSPVPNPVPSPWRTRPDGTAAEILSISPGAYYLRPCSRPAGSECASTDDDGRPIPTTVRQELSGLVMVEQPVAEGIERMNVLYGLDDATVANRDG